MLSPPGTWTYTWVAEAFHARRLNMPNSHGDPDIAGCALQVLPVDLPGRWFPVAVVTLKN